MLEAASLTQGITACCRFTFTIVKKYCLKKGRCCSHRLTFAWYWYSTAYHQLANIIYLEPFFQLIIRQFSSIPRPYDLFTYRFFSVFFLQMMTHTMYKMWRTQDKLLDYIKNALLCMFSSCNVYKKRYYIFHNLDNN